MKQENPTVRLESSGFSRGEQVNAMFRDEELAEEYLEWMNG